MDYKMDLTDELRKTLMESAAWDRVGLRPIEGQDSEEVLQEGTEVATEDQEEDAPISLEEIHTLLSELSEEELLEHIDSVLSVVEAVTEVLEEEAEYEDEE
jgi:hypothetical protein